MSKRFLYILIFIFLTSCSLSKKDNEINDGSINIFEKIEPIKKELNTDLKISHFRTTKLTVTVILTLIQILQKYQIINLVKLKNLNFINLSYFSLILMK